MPGGAKEVSCLSWLARTYNTEGLPLLLACCTAMFISCVGCFQCDFTSAQLGHTEVVIATLLCTPRPCQMPRIQPRLLPEKRCCHSSPQAKSLGLANIEDKVWHLSGCGAMAGSAPAKPGCNRLCCLLWSVACFSCPRMEKRICCVFMIKRQHGGCCGLLFINMP